MTAEEIRESGMAGGEPDRDVAVTPRTIIIASDHGGYALKKVLEAELAEAGYEIHDLGPDSEDSVDYPDYGHALGEAIASGRETMGVLLCGSGIGMSIAANRHAGVRAALCHDGLSARLARQHNDANVLVLGGRLIGVETAKDCLRTFLETSFEGGRHARRVEKLG